MTPRAPDPPPVLSVTDLRVRFDLRTETVHAVNGISYSVSRGAALAIVGESGSGKTVSALALMGLLSTPPAHVESGGIAINGRDISNLSPREWQGVRGREIAMVFQDPLTSLNPVLTIGRQMTESLRHHLHLGADEARARARELLSQVGIPNAGGRLSDYPHEFSGGQRQRIGIAMALSCEPAILIADEPTTALDVTIQAQIIDLVERLQAELGIAIVWITHDLALVAGFADQVAVMYGGTIVEMGSAEEIYAHPRHPYTRGLLDALPSLEGEATARLTAIEGSPPDLRAPLVGCPFAARCDWAEARCHAELPPLLETDSPSRSACWRWEEMVG